jgi:GT2 family glycosyltransferase
VSIYEDTEEYNYSKEYSSAIFFERVRFYERDGALAAPANDLVLIERILSELKARSPSPVFPTISVPLTFLAIRRGLYEMLGGFDGKFFVGGENIDFTLRALQKGFYAAVVNNTYVHHRRLFFKAIGSGGENNKLAWNGQTVLHDYWKKKWNAGWEDIYGEQIYGSSLYRFAIKPLRKLRNRVFAAMRHSDASVSTRKA